MKPPRFLLGLGLALWGSCADVLWFGVLLGALVEILLAANLRLRFETAEFNRVTDLGTLLSIGAIGYFAAMTVAMVTRVSLGHSGRALEADRLSWFGFLGLIATGAVRALADLPENARRYVTAIEEHAGVPIVLVSVGPERTQTIERAWRPVRRPGIPA